MVLYLKNKIAIVIMSGDKLSSLPFFVIDTETTGLEQDDTPVSIAIITIRNMEIMDRWYSLVNPNKKISEVAQSIHGISQEMVANSPTLTQLAPFILQRIGSNICVAHNSVFDGRMLPFIKNSWIDTLAWCRLKYNDLERYTNESMCTFLNIQRPEGNAHNALYDAEITANIFIELMRNCEFTILDLKRYMSTFTVLKTCQLKKYKGRPWKSVPKEYLQWIVKTLDKGNIRFTAKYYLTH